MNDEAKAAMRGRLAFNYWATTITDDLDGRLVYYPAITSIGYGQFYDVTRPFQTEDEAFNFAAGILDSILHPAADLLVTTFNMKL